MPIRRATANRILKFLAGVYLVALLAAVMAYKAAFAGLLFSNVFFGVYSVCVATYIVSRFVFSLFYRPWGGRGSDPGIEPAIAIVMPGFNEE